MSGGNSVQVKGRLDGAGNLVTRWVPIHRVAWIVLAAGVLAASLLMSAGDFWLPLVTTAGLGAAFLAVMQFGVVPRYGDRPWFQIGYPLAAALFLTGATWAAGVLFPPIVLAFLIPVTAVAILSEAAWPTWAVAALAALSTALVLFARLPLDPFPGLIAGGFAWVAFAGAGLTTRALTREQRQAAVATLQDRLQIQTAVGAITSAVAHGREPGEILAGALAAAQPLGLEMAILYLREGLDRFRLGAQAGVALAHCPHMLSISPVLLERLFAAGQPVRFTGRDSDRIPEFLQGTGVVSGITVPVLDQNGYLFGLVTLAARRPQVGMDTAILSTLEPVLSTALNNYRLTEQARAQFHDLTQAYTATATAQTELEQAYLGIGYALTMSLEARDPYTRGHSDRVAQVARKLGRALGLDSAEAERLHVAALLHDIGKIAIPDRILLKAGPLSDAEWAVMKQHPTRGVELLSGLQFLADTFPAIRHHHERYDGCGYPECLAGAAIPLGARILAVADAYDAMTSNRAYRGARTHAQALAVLQAGAGTQWDPQAVDAFASLYTEQPPWEQPAECSV